MSGLTESEFAAKVDSEGLFYAIFEYGLTADALDDPESELGRKWKELSDALRTHRGLLADVEELLDEALDD